MTPYRYSVYGFSLRSEIPLNLPQYRDGILGQIDIRTAPADWFTAVTRNIELSRSVSSWYRCGLLPDQSSYARWEEVGEFLVPPDGRTIICRQSNQASAESFQVYLLGQALSFALVNQGFEPLHATAVVARDQAIAFLGDSGYGKSTLAATFLSAGYRILTDDLLIVRDEFAYPGPSRLKLFPSIAQEFLGISGDGASMNTTTRKMILPLGPAFTQSAPVKLRAIYCLTPLSELCPNQDIHFQTLSVREAFLEIVRNTFNTCITNAPRLRRQFTEASRFAAAYPVRRLLRPCDLTRIAAVRDAILDDLKQDDSDQSDSQELAACAV